MTTHIYLVDENFVGWKYCNSLSFHEKCDSVKVALTYFPGNIYFNRMVKTGHYLRNNKLPSSP